jgi:hypothetical protein
MAFPERSAAVAAAGKMFDVAFIENTCAVRELGEVEVAAVIDLEDHWPLGGERDIPRLGADARQDLCRLARKRIPLGYQGADDWPLCVGMGLVEAHLHAGSA